MSSHLLSAISLYHCCPCLGGNLKTRVQVPSGQLRRVYAHKHNALFLPVTVRTWRRCLTGCPMDFVSIVDVIADNGSERRPQQ